MKEKVKSDIYLEIESKITDVLHNLYFHLVDIEIVKSKNKKITIYIYNNNSTNINALSEVSKKLYPVLESIPFFSDGFDLEISSPGLFREIKNYSEFNIFIDKDIKLTLEKSVVITGLLKEVKSNSLIIKNKDNKDVEISFDNIIKAKLNG